MADATVTLRTLSLGAQDTYTGWHAKSFATSELDMIILPRGASYVVGGIGYYARYEVTGVTDTLCHVGDEILDQNSQYFVVKSVEPVYRLDQFSHYVVEMVRRDYADQPTTSGTWYEDTDSVVVDPRYRMIVWLTSQFPAYFFKDNGTTELYYIWMFEHPPYPMASILTSADLDKDMCITVDHVDTKHLNSFSNNVYGYEDTVNVTFWCMDKTGITAVNALDQAAQWAIGSTPDSQTGFSGGTGGQQRLVKVHKPTFEWVGATKLWKLVVTFVVRRSNDEFQATFPRFAEGIGWTYECDRKSGGAEGTWTENLNGSTATFTCPDQYKNLDINITVFVGDVSFETATAGNNLGLSTDIWGKIRFRYKTTGSAKAKIVVVFNDASTQTVNSEDDETYWATATVDLTASKTLDHIYLYACDGVGHVYYDFIQVYTSDYVFPNVVKMELPMMMNAPKLPIPNRSGAYTQMLGSDSIEVRMICDLSMATSSLAWLRPQDDTPTDFYPWWVFFEQIHYQGSNAQYLWTWMDIRAGEASYWYSVPALGAKMQLISMRPAIEEGPWMLELVWREYTHGSKGSETSFERLGRYLASGGLP